MWKVIRDVIGLLRFRFTSLCDWSKKLIASRSVRFPALLTVCFCFELSLANDDVNLCAYWLLSLLWLRFFGTHLKTALKEKKERWRSIFTC